MKHLLTAIACCLAVAGSAQTPYNPDSDGNNLMGAEDLMSLLSLYGGEFYPNNTPVFQTCSGDYSVFGDSCFVDEQTDVIFLDGANIIVLPFDSSYKKVQFLPYDNSVSDPVSFRTEENPLFSVGFIFNSKAGYLVRTLTGRWHLHS